MENLNRRNFLKLTSAAGLTLYLSPYSSAFGASRDISADSPIDRSLPDVAPKQYYGDDPDAAHKVLWNIEALLASTPAAAAESAPLVVIGGGMSGLITAYLLRKHRPIVLEQAARFGGNSKGQSWRGIDYSIGAAYICEPEEDSEIAALLRELRIDKKAVIKSGEDPVAVNGKIFNAFWGGETLANDPKAKAQCDKLRVYFETVFEGETIAYPEIPIRDDSLRLGIEDLDRVSFKDHVQSLIEGPLHPNFEAALEHYCWSSLGAGFTEVSAAAGLNFYAAEFGNLWVYPGGNSAIAERILSDLSAELPQTHLRTRSVVCEVKASDSGVSIKYIDSSGALKTINAAVAVCACPKFIAAKFIRDLEAERLEAIRKLRYRSYLVANVMLKGAPPERFYDLYLLGSGMIGNPDLRTECAKQGVTDVILANFAHANRDNSVLTLYRALPYDGARPEIYSPASYDQFRGQFEKQIHEEILPLLKMKAENIVDIRLARWGHPLPVAVPGLIANGVVNQLRKPFRDRVFFVEQDNWALPAFETAATESILFAPQIEKALERFKA